MTDRPPSITARLAYHLPGWLFFTSGILLIAMTMLMPSWLECRQLRWQRDVMQIQARSLSDQDRAYRQFYQALSRRDPILLERLAFHHLRLKPAGAQNLMAVSSAHNPDTIESWLHEPLPRIGVELPALQPVQTRLVRITTGPMRLPLLGVGVLCLVAGLTSACGDDLDD